MFSGRKILLGVSGSIAVYKAVDLLRQLTGQGADVRVVMTRNATRFVSAMTFSVLSGHPVLTDDAAWDADHVRHIDVTEGVDAMIVAPATANIIGKTASGLADDILSTTIMACGCPLVMAPAMNERMYRNFFLQRNISMLKDQGVRIVEPECGPLACGSTGIGRLASTEVLLREIGILLAPRALVGMNILVTAGPTREPIDAVRFISNPSTGKMGYSLAAAARDQGANVTLVTGPTHLEPPAGITLVPVMTSLQMRDAVLKRVPASSVLVMAAAVSDFRPRETYDRKIKKDNASMAVQLERTPDILQEIGESSPTCLLVGFAAETDDLRANAESKLRRKNLDLVVANAIGPEGVGFGAETNAVTIIDRRGNITELPLMSKRNIADRIMGMIAEIKANQGL